MGEPEFFLLYAKKDDSFCVVSCSDVIFECPVAVNDQVKFMYTQDGVKKQYAGVVKEFGDDFKTLVDRLPYWNKTRQKPKVPSARRKSRQSKQSRQRKKGDHNSLSDSESGMTRNLVATDEDDSASGPELTPEEIEALVKDARKKRKLDLKQLSTLSASKRNPFNSDSDSEDEQPLIRVRQFASHVDRESSLSSTHTTTINTPPDSQEDSDPKDTVVRRKRRRYEKMVYEGQYYRFKEGDPGVVELSFNVYVLEKDLKRIKRDSKSGPMMARLLLKAIYTKEACNECSPTGRPSGREKIQRPPLHADGISAAHDFITKRAEKRHWPAITTTVVKKAFSDVLCEDRYTAKLFAEDKMQKEAAAASAALLAEAAGSREG